MRKAGARLNYSDSYISQIENGRENVPTGERLMKFLNLYGEITEKYFKQLCKEWRDEGDEMDKLVELAKKLPAPKLKTLIALAEQMAAGQI
jgi:transcriptional regulator with XRE-family HTH domain